jgi:hypothetical protein
MFFYAGVVLSVCYSSRMQAPFRFALDDIDEIEEDFQLLMTNANRTSWRRAAVPRRLPRRGRVRDQGGVRRARRSSA